MDISPRGYRHTERFLRLDTKDILQIKVTTRLILLEDEVEGEKR